MKEEWVSVKEKLPEGRLVPVLVFNGDAPKYNQCVSQATWFSQENNFVLKDDTLTILGKITHWMPLPTPPSDKENVDN